MGWIKDRIRRYLGIEEMKDNQIELEDQLQEQGIIHDPIIDREINPEMSEMLADVSDSLIDQQEALGKLQDHIKDHPDYDHSKDFDELEPVDDWFDL